MTRLAIAKDCPDLLAALHALGVPKHASSIEVRIPAGGFVEITCTFVPEAPVAAEAVDREVVFADPGEAGRMMARATSAPDAIILHRSRASR